MADSDQSSEDRTLEPSAKRLADARRQGRVPRSRDLSHLMVLGTAVLALSMLGSQMAQACRGVLVRGLTFDQTAVSDPARMGARLAELAIDVTWTTLPLLIAMLASAFAAPLLIGGWNFAPDTVVPRLDRLDPLNGMRRFFSLSSLVELGKVAVVAALLSVAGAFTIAGHMSDFAALSLQALPAAAAELAAMLLAAFMLLTGTLAVAAAIDVPYQVTRYRHQLRMTVQEARQEEKESQGDPRIKQRVRSAQREMARKRMMAAVPKADVVVTNPTHFAVALKYLQARHRAPIVVAKGMGAVADRIRALATENGVPHLEAPPLARALYRHVDIGSEIPAALYNAVAQVLAYVYQLKRYRDGQAQPPQVPREIPIPPGLDPFEPRATA
ncbi:MAG TPA: flagellar biosynthesis protein FlhB [Burkholderiaceae bacterium]|nr:flagellar biosynthesis protein FlhB [Burkholderiaceae bacterium]